MIFGSKMFVFLLCILFKQTLAALPTVQPLKRYNITNFKNLGAICNDASPGIYYLHKFDNSKKWLIFIEGGGSCTSPNGDCIKRSKAKPYYTSSNYYPDYITPKTIMADETFVDYNKALLVQCSSDLWLGNSSDNPEPFNSNQTEPIAFRGAVIFHSIMKELITKGMDEANEVYINGRSAGGYGIVSQLKNLQSMLPAKTKIYSTLDSSWLLNYENFLNRSSEDALDTSGVMKMESCRDESWGFPCCFSVPCMVARSYVPENIPVLLLISKYDIYPLFNTFMEHNTSFEEVLQSQDILSTVNSYGGRLEQTLQTLYSKPNIAYALSNCFHHGYLVSSNLWNLLYNPKFVLTFQSVQFQHIVNESVWNDVRIAGRTIREIILNWKTKVASETTKQQLHHYRDECQHANCNPTCPNVVFFDDFDGTEAYFPMRFVLVISVLLITAVCLVARFYWILRNVNLNRSQNAFLRKSYNDGSLYENVMSLPACPPQETIGISCIDLGKCTLKHEVYDLSYKPQTAKISDVSKKSKLNGISAYFNPGQFVAIIAPKRSGKTELLDILAARKCYNETESNVFFNGIPSSNETREWFRKNSGYVPQFATPYHEALTVRQNLTYSAMMVLPMEMTMKEKLLRVEEAIGQCGLYDVADIIVGDPSIDGLSEGMKRQLCIALQLLDLPSVIFLDEPTTGLDLPSSLELLKTLHKLTLSGRLVILTVHEPSIEILHMFDTILLMCNGQVGFFGSPVMVPHMSTEALIESDKPFDSSHPNDSIMDILTNNSSQKNILDYYLQSGEIQAINDAIARAKRYPQKTLSMTFQKPNSNAHDRLLALDGRSSTSETVSQMFYLPVVFSLYVLALATSYYQTNDGIFLMSCYMVFSCASQLFMGSVINTHLNKALTLFKLEKQDGVSSSTELVLHTFVKTFSKSFFPVLCSCCVIYLCTVRDYVLWKFCLTTLIHLQLNQVWIAIIICTACCVPEYSALVTPILSACAGFAGGFLIPENHMPSIFYWMFYVNPTQWAYSAMTKILMQDVKFHCNQGPAPLECLNKVGILILKSFGFSDRNSYVSMLVLLIMLIIFLTLAIIIVEIKHSKINLKNYLEDLWCCLRNSSTLTDEHEMKWKYPKWIESKYKIQNNEDSLSTYSNHVYSTDTSGSKGNEKCDITNKTIINKWLDVDHFWKITLSGSQINENLIKSVDDIMIYIPPITDGYQQSLPMTDDCQQNLSMTADLDSKNGSSASRSESFQSICTTPSGLNGRLVKKDTTLWSKCLYPSKCHEVHSSLNFITDLRWKRNRNCVKKVLRKSEYTQIEEQSQSFILNQKKHNLRKKLYALRSQTYDSSHEEEENEEGA